MSLIAASSAELTLVIAVFAFMMMCILAFTIGSFFLLARPWVRAAASGAPVTIFSILGMRLRGNPPTLLVDAYASLKRSGESVTIADVELTYIDNRTRVRQATDLVELVKAKNSSS